MKQYINLTKRNCLVFLRDRSAVFFSILAMLIVLMLNGVFLGDMNVNNVVDLLAEYGGVRDTLADEENARQLIQYWTLAGILIVNAVMVTLTVIGTMVDDDQDGRIVCFYSAPVHRNIIAFSYITSAVLIGMLFCMFTLGIAMVYIAATGGELLSLTAFGKLFVMVLLNVSIFAVIMYLAALFVKSSGAWSGIGTVVGTLAGFLGGIYLPMGFLPEEVFYFESVDQKVFAYCKTDVYEVKSKLYELLEELPERDFIRASKSFILNLNQIKSLSPAFGGRYEALLKNREKIIISRQYVPVLKEKLGV